MKTPTHDWERRFLAEFAHTILFRTYDEGIETIRESLKSFIRTEIEAAEKREQERILGYVDIMIAQGYDTEPGSLRMLRSYILTPTNTV